MPVTIYPAPHASSPCRIDDLLRNASPKDVLQRCTALKLKDGQTNPTQNLEAIWNSSFDHEEHVDVYASANGFVHSAIRAYNAHHHLRLRPDDVWIAILSQLSIYVNKHAEALRSIFVSHQGKKALDLDSAVLNGFEGFAAKITEVLSKSVKDQTLPPWIMQEFSTTTPTDRIAAGIIMMATFQSYFKYFDACTCGLPSVTLLGERADWVQLLGAVDRLKELIPEQSSNSSSKKETDDVPTAQMMKWVSVLKPVLTRFVKSFDAPNASETIDFWQQIADYRVGGSGADYLSGWLTAFCFWTESGECTFPLEKGEGWGLCLDNTYYTHVEWQDVPPGWASVPLEIDFDDGQVHKCRMLAGSVGITPFLAQISDAGEDVSTLNPKDPAGEHGHNLHRQRVTKRRNIVRKLLSCCGSDKEPDVLEAPKPSAPVTKEREITPYPAPGEVIYLPPYPGQPAHHGSSNQESIWRGQHDYEKGWGLGQNQIQPPPYKLDGLQPRIGWWLWEEDVVPGSAPLPDGLEDYKKNLD